MLKKTQSFRNSSTRISRLPVENVPEALPAHADAARKFGHSYTAHTPRIFYSLDD